MPAQPFQTWGGTSAPTALFFRDATGFRIRFPGVVEFLVSDSGDVLGQASLGVDSSLWSGIYEQQLQPLLSSLRGEQVFHGGAVNVDGQVIAFLAPSGRGKSTLTTAFALRGHAFLGDDCLHLDLSGDPIRVNPQPAFIRLWEDSAARLGHERARYRAGSPKPYLQADQALPHCDQPLPLSRLYVLGEGEVEAPTITPLSPSQALIGLTANAFVLDIKNPDVLKRNLAAAARVVREIPVCRLDYPRDYEVLSAVVDAVLADTAA